MHSLMAAACSSSSCSSTVTIMEPSLWLLTLIPSAMALVFFHPFPLFRNNFVILFCLILTRRVVRWLRSRLKLPPSSPMGSYSPVMALGKEKVVFVMGATGTGKSKLAIDLALLFSGEIINSDKMQVYKGLDVVTNKVTANEQAQVPHHLLGVVEPDADFTAADFRRSAMDAIEEAIGRGKLPIVAGGSNSYIESLVDDPAGEFRSRYDCCFLWVDVNMAVLHSFVSDRVDKMVEAGLVEEVTAMFHPEADYTKGIRRAIGMPEMDRYNREDSPEKRAKLLSSAIDEIKANTCLLSCCQLVKIHRLAQKPGWDIHRLVATDAFLATGEEVAAAWASNVALPASALVQRFLSGGTLTNGLSLPGRRRWLWPTPPSSPFELA